MKSDRSIFEVRFRVPLDRFYLDVDFAASQRVTGLFGVSGSGKTTWIEAMAGLRNSVKGLIRFGETVWLDSEKRINVPPEKRNIGYVPQDHLLFKHKTVRGNLEVGKQRAIQGGHDFAQIFQRVVETLELGGLLERRVTDLSGGERQRVALGRALCSGPKLLLLDEPLASLDLGLRERILPFLQRIRETYDLPIVIVSHNPIEVQTLCDELVVLNQGKIIATGKPADVLTRPEVFRANQVEGFINTLSGRVVGHEAHTTRVRVGESGSAFDLIIPRAEVSVSEKLIASLEAGEILLSKTEPVGLSARNQIPATVSSIKAIEHRRLIEAVVDQTEMPLIAEVTEDAIAEMKLAVGSNLFLIIKSSSIKVCS